METNLKFNSAICTSREQSERLLAMGLKKNTADCYYYAQQRWTGNSYENTGELFLSPLWDINDKGHFQYLNEVFGDEIGEEDTPYVLPAWSLHRLIKMMPSFIDIGEHTYMFSMIQGKLVSYRSNIAGNALLYGKGSVYDSVIYTIEWLIGEGLFNKEYLEE